MTIEGGLRDFVRRRLLSDFERGILDDLRVLDERVEELETQEFTQPGVTGGYTLIEEKSPTGGSSVTFSSIPSTFRHLELWAIAQAEKDPAGEGWTVGMRINGNTTAANYHQTTHFYVDSRGGSGDLHTLAGVAVVDYIHWLVAPDPGDADIANEEFGFGIAKFPYYASTVAWKGVNAQSGFFIGSNRVNIEGRTTDGRVKETNAISSIELFFPSAGVTYQTGTKFSLYGIG